MRPISWPISRTRSNRPWNNSRAARFRSSQGVLSAENAAGESFMDGPLPSGGTLWLACSSICEIHADLSPGSRCHTVLLCSKRTRLPTMSTIELVDPELRDALALSPQVPLSGETLMRRRADALALLSSVPIPDLPDIATGEIHVERGLSQSFSAHDPEGNCAL